MNDVINQTAITQSVLNAENILKKGYLSNIREQKLIEINYPVESTSDQFVNHLNENVRFFDITQIVLNKNENMRDKLVSVFNAVGNVGTSILFHIDGKKDKVSIRIGVRRNFEDIDKGLAQEILQNSLEGNFPGSTLKLLSTDELNNVVHNFDTNLRVVSVTDIAGLRSENDSKDRQFMQGIEKVIEALKGKEYSMLLIADPISMRDLNLSRRALENVYSSLVPFSESEFSFGENQSESINASISKSTTETLSEGISESISHTNGKSYSRAFGVSYSHTDGKSHSTTDGYSDTNSSSVNVGIGVAGMNRGKSHSESHSTTSSESYSNQYGTNQTNTSSQNSSKTVGMTNTQNISTATGMTQMQGVTQNIGTSQSIQVKFENHTIKKMLERIDKTLERYNKCADLGAWNCAMYCVSDKATAQICASIYRSVIRGENSSLENSAMILWEQDQNYGIMEALKHMQHPRLNVNNVEVTPGALINSAELAIHAGLPNHSIAGVPVIECAEFGRVVSSYIPKNNESKINLGNIFHMLKDEKIPVELNAKSLCSHTFITGSTGSGKSNTVYGILNKLPSEVKFLVVEPAKGEYKNVFGSKAKVYGTNPSLTELLKINPFSFPKEIHVLEHIDRLIEIFNVCWPMYAAMPAVLKDAVEKSYEDAGWDLTNSTNAYGENLYPEFSDVARNIKSIIDSSEYDAENKGAYKGSLLTRLKSLTNGLNGLIFNRDEISSEELFDKNVIVDLSRVGSAETKSLIMGVLVLKLQEYRMSNANGMNSELKHITVLEEAHNLLKRTSTEQSSESANLIGKSVEMLTNAIAEMRTYGEGFIIADQAPALLDMAVIRNTNTKIIMRLPDQDDRELVGKAANLNDDQITELAKLPCGVAAVYQNEWIEPVLCKIGVAESKSGTYKCDRTTKAKDESDTGGIKIKIADLLCKGIKVGKEELVKDLDKLELKSSIRVEILKYLQNPPKEVSVLRLAPIMSELFPVAKRAFMESYKAFVSDTKQWSIATDNALAIEIDELRRKIRQCIITDYICNDVGEVSQLEKWSFDGGRI